MKTPHLAGLLVPALVACALAGCRATPDYARPLPAGWPALLPLAPGEPRPDLAQEWYARDEILPALNPVLVALRPERRQKQTKKRRRGSKLVWWLGAALMTRPREGALIAGTALLMLGTCQTAYLWANYAVRAWPLALVSLMGAAVLAILYRKSNQ